MLRPLGKLAAWQASFARLKKYSMTQRWGASISELILSPSKDELGLGERFDGRGMKSIFVPIALCESAGKGAIILSLSKSDGVRASSRTEEFLVRQG